MKRFFVRLFFGECNRNECLLPNLRYECDANYLFAIDSLTSQLLGA